MYSIVEMGTDNMLIYHVTATHCAVLSTSISLLYYLLATKKILRDIRKCKLLLPYRYAFHVQPKTSPRHKFLMPETGAQALLKPHFGRRRATWREKTVIIVKRVTRMVTTSEITRLDRQLSMLNKQYAFLYKKIYEKL